MPTTIRIRSCRRLFRFAFSVSSILFRSKGVRRLSSPPIPDRRWLVQSFAGLLRPIGFPPYHTTAGRLLQCKKMQKFRVFPAASSQQGAAGSGKTPASLSYPAQSDPFPFSPSSFRSFQRSGRLLRPAAFFMPRSAPVPATGSGEKGSRRREKRPQKGLNKFAAAVFV